MGMNASGILAYGYDLGGGDGEFKICNVNDDGGFDTPWWSDDDDFDISDAMEKLLLADVGFTETDWQVDGFWSRRLEAESRLGVKLIYNGSDQYSGILLVTWDTNVSWGEVSVIDFGELNLRRLNEDWDGQLDHALEVLGLEPVRGCAEWLLAASYG